MFEPLESNRQAFEAPGPKDVRSNVSSWQSSSKSKQLYDVNNNRHACHKDDRNQSRTKDSRNAVVCAMTKTDRMNWPFGTHSKI